jgi:hypothetical protein
MMGQFRSHALTKEGIDMKISRDIRLQRQLQSQLQYLLKLTNCGVVRWKRTAAPNETFTRGIFVATIWEDSLRRYFSLVSSEGRSQVLATSADCDLVDALFSAARSKPPFDVQKAITDIILSRS